MSLDRSKHLTVFLDESPVLDMKDEGIQYRVSDFALGTGFSKTRLFKGELADFHFAYKEYRKNPLGDYLVLGAVAPPLLIIFFLFGCLIRRRIAGMERIHFLLRKWSRSRFWKPFSPVVDGKFNFKGVLWILAVFTAALFLLQIGGLNDLRILGSKLPGGTGRLEGRVRTAFAGRDLPGVLTYGPYAHLEPGVYDVKLKYSASSEKSGAWDLIFAGKEVSLKKGVLPKQESGWFRENLSIHEGETHKGLEFRVWYTGEGTLQVEEMVIARKVALLPALGWAVSRGILASLLLLLAAVLVRLQFWKGWELSAKHGIFVLAAFFALLRFWQMRYWLEFPDETDNIVVGWLVSQGYTLYKDLFAHHMPITYMLAHGIVTLFPHQDFQQYRLVQPILILASALAVAKSPVFSRSRAGWIAGSIFMAFISCWFPVWWGNQFRTEAHWANGFLVWSFLLFLPILFGVEASRMKRWPIFWGALALPFWVSGSLSTVYPLLASLSLIAVFSIFSRTSQKTLGKILRTPLFYAGLAIVPLIHVVWLSLHASWRGFFDLAISFNNVVYAKYMGLPAEMNSFRRACLLMINGWMFVIGTNPNTGGSLWIEKGELILRFFLILGVVAPLFLFPFSFRKRMGVSFSVLLVCVSLFLRGGGCHGQPFYLFTVAWAATCSGIWFLKGQKFRILILSLVALACLASVKSASVWNYVGSSEKANLGYALGVGEYIQSRCGPEDRIASFFCFPILYYTARRLPATYSIYYFPWQADWEKAKDPGDPRTCRELKEARPKYVFMQRVQGLMGGRFNWEDYASCIDQYVLENYRLIPELAFVYERK